MVKKISALALAGLIALPTIASASNGDMQAQIDALTRQLEALKAQMEETTEAIDDKSAKWDLASRIQFSGDFRTRLDNVSATTKAHYSALDTADTMMANAVTNYGSEADAFNALYAGLLSLPADQRGAAIPGFAPLLAGVPVTAAQDYENDTNWTNRFRLNMRVQALENVEFKGRLAMYKSWGMQNNPLGQDVLGPYTLSSMGFDGNSSRTMGSNALVVDRAIVNWNNIGGLPVWFSIGRRPTSDGPPAQLRLGSDERMATPAAFMDYPFDGLTVGYAYQNLFGLTDGPGRIRFCYGRGFESGPTTTASTGLNDVDFAGFAWDIYNKEDRFVYFQSYGAFNMFNVPDNVTFPNPLEIAMQDNMGSIVGDDNIEDVMDLAAIQAGAANGILDRANLGDIYHTSVVYKDKVDNFNFFVSGSWSHTNPRGWDEAGNSLLTSWWGDLQEKDGYSIYLGGRYDIPDMGLRFGAEYNHGTENWISFTPGHDELYQSKLATRGDVYEVYGIWDIPGGEAVSKFGKAFMRLGYMHYEYDYTGSGYWLGAPADMDELTTSPLNAQFYAPIEDMDQVYLTFEANF
ncbi:MAG: DUF3373 domain-containing protein [Desulfobulbaceae bacterium]|nr:DUF3373 domain-containing protein [Desulfobulbaceae bacterium]